MKLLKLTVLPAAILSCVFLLASCKKEEDRRRVDEYANDIIPMNAAQSVPSNASPATGNLSVYYNRKLKSVFFRVTWSGLTGPVSSIGVYGPAPAGYLTPGAAGPAGPLFTVAGTGLGSSGSYGTSIYVDGSVIKEQTLLNGLYYVRINTATNNVFGEIRGQIKF